MVTSELFTLKLKPEMYFELHPDSPIWYFTWCVYLGISYLAGQKQTCEFLPTLAPSTMPFIVQARNLPLHSPVLTSLPTSMHCCFFLQHTSCSGPLLSYPEPLSSAPTWAPPGTSKEFLGFYFFCSIFFPSNIQKYLFKILKSVIPSLQVLNVFRKHCFVLFGEESFVKYFIYINIVGIELGWMENIFVENVFVWSLPVSSTNYSWVKIYIWVKDLCAFLHRPKEIF